MAVTDSIVTECGPLGRYQFIQAIIIFSVYIVGSQHFLVVNFHNFEPDHRCALPGWNNDTYDAILSPERNLTLQQLVYNDDNACTYNSTKCTKFVYSRERYDGNTIVSQFNLVCDHKGLSTISTTIFTCSLMIGAFAGGIIADRIGRRWTLVVSAFIPAICSIAVIFSQNMYMYIALRAVIGACYTSAVLVGHVLVMEITGPRKRPLAMVIRSFFWPFGCLSLSPIAYFLPDWDQIQIVITATAFISAFSILFFVRESPHFLVSKGRHEDAESILRGMADTNGRTVDDSVFNRLEQDEEAAAREKLVDIFKARTLLLRSVIFFYLWFVGGFGYYGLSFNVRNMVGNVFSNHALISSVDMFASASIILSKYVGRKAICISHLALGAAALLASALLILFTDLQDNNMAITILVVSLIGKYGLSVIFAFNYFWCSEVFPTSLRSSLSGVASLFARVGSILSPTLVDLYKYVDTVMKSGLGPLIFSITMIIGAVLCFFLPETNNTRVPETIHEANIFMTKGHEEEFRADVEQDLDYIDGYNSNDNEKFTNGPELVSNTQL